MIIKTLEEISQMLEQPFEGANVEVKGVSTDTRQISPGNLYVPLKGANFDGHNFYEKALEAGASALLWDKNRKDMPKDVPVILVEDTLLALQKLAYAYRQMLNIYIIAITGSNGKTSTKDMLASILATEYKTGKNKGNRNNHIGTPLTILDFDSDTELGVVEMGMSGFREISLLSNIAAPDMAVITNIGDAHLADLGGKRDNIAIAKLEILEGLKEGGIFIAHNENPRVNKALQRLQGISMSYDNESGNFYPYEIKETRDGMSFKVAGFEEEFVLPLMGEHQVYNAVAAIVCAHKLGIKPENMKQGLLNAEYTPQRGQIIKAGSHVIIDDTYKSNPASLKAAIDTVGIIEFEGKKALVIGDMKDLGEETQSLHEEIGAYIAPEKIDYVFTVGAYAQRIAEVCKNKFPDNRVWCFEDKKTAMDQLWRVMDQENVLVLLKGARVLQLEEMVKGIIERYKV